MIGIAHHWRHWVRGLAGVLSGLLIGSQAYGQPLPQSLAGSWIIKDVRFGNGATGYQVPTNAQRRQLLQRIGKFYQVPGSCGQGGPKLNVERTTIPKTALVHPETSQHRRLASLGILALEQQVVQLSMMCGNASSNMYWWVPAGARSQLFGGHNINEMVDYEYLLERPAIQSPPPANRALPSSAQVQWDKMRGTWIPQKDHNPRFCSTKSSFPPPPTYLGIGQTQITRFEEGCDIVGITPLPDAQLRVTLNCGAFNDRSERQTQTFRLSNNRLIIDGVPHVRCSLPQGASSR